MIRRHPHKHVSLCLVLEEKLWKRQLWYEDSVTLVQPLVLSQFLHYWSSTGPAYADGNCSLTCIIFLVLVSYIFRSFYVFCRTKSPCFRCIMPVFISKQEFLAHSQWVSQISECQPEKDRVWALLMWWSVNLKQQVPPGKVCASLVPLAFPSHIRDTARFCW